MVSHRDHVAVPHQHTPDQWIGLSVPLPTQREFRGEVQKASVLTVTVLQVIDCSLVSDVTILNLSLRKKQMCRPRFQLCHGELPDSRKDR